MAPPELPPLAGIVHRWRDELRVFERNRVLVRRLAAIQKALEIDPPERGAAAAWAEVLRQHPDDAPLIGVYCYYLAAYFATVEEARGMIETAVETARARLGQAGSSVTASLWMPGTGLSAPELEVSATLRSGVLRDQKIRLAPHAAALGALAHPFRLHTVTWRPGDGALALPPKDLLRRVAAHVRLGAQDGAGIIWASTGPAKATLTTGAAKDWAQDRGGIAPERRRPALRLLKSWAAATTGLDALTMHMQQEPLSGHERADLVRQAAGGRGPAKTKHAQETP